MYTLKIDPETMDGIIKQALIHDYRSLRDATHDLMNRPIRPFETEDLLNNVKWVEAMKTLLTFYLVDEEYEDLMAEEPQEQFDWSFDEDEEEEVESDDE